MSRSIVIGGVQIWTAFSTFKRAMGFKPIFIFGWRIGVLWIRGFRICWKKGNYITIK